MVLSDSWKNQRRVIRPALKILLAALGLSARHFLDFAFFRSASVIAGLERMFELALLARSPLGFFAVFFA
jgi:hypothetical protein